MTSSSDGRRPLRSLATASSSPKCARASPRSRSGAQRSSSDHAISTGCLPSRGGVADRALRLPEEVQATIRVMHPELKRRVRAALDHICATPTCGKALMGELTGWRSLRVGGLRIVYREARRALEIAAIGPRSTIYVDLA